MTEWEAYITQEEIGPGKFGVNLYFCDTSLPPGQPLAPLDQCPFPSPARSSSVLGLGVTDRVR